MFSLSKFFSILLIVTVIYNTQETKCGDDFNKLGPLGYNILDNLIAKYYSKSDNIESNDDTNNQLLQDQILDYAEYKPIKNRVSKAYNLYMNEDEDENKQMKGNLELNYFNPNNNQNNKLFDNHGIRDEEFLEKSSLWRHQTMQGGAGEGEQRLKPDGSVSNVQVIKTDSIIPSYCNPPNPCPLGYTGEDGCLEEFKNTASFSRDYQSMQNCMCDSEHMFNCESNDQAKLKDEEEKSFNKQEDEERELNTIARSLANQDIGENAADQLISTLVDHKVVAKKFFTKKSSEPNPFLKNQEKLPIVAKKSPSLSQ